MDMNFGNVSESYRRFARREASISPVYQRWCEAIADDAAVCELIARLPEMKRQPNLVFAAARLLLGEQAREESASGWVLDDAAPDELLELLRRRWDEIEETVTARSTQTNEPGRCAVHLTQLSQLEGPVALIEVGHSAGLTLIPDLYRYEYSDEDGSAHHLEAPDQDHAPLLRCEISGLPFPQRLPEIVWRGGIDLNPLNLDPQTERGAAQLQWMKALIWPGHEARAERLEAAAAQASEARTAGPFVEVTGDLLTELPGLIERARREAPEAQIAVIHTAVIAYLPEPAEFEALMHRLLEESNAPLTWLSCEGPGVLPGIAARLPHDAVTAEEFVLSRNGEPVAAAHPWGYSVRSL